MGIACKYCVAAKGLKLDSPWVFKTEEEFFEHIEMEHDLPAARPGETEEEAKARLKAKNPRAGGPDCQCPYCLAKRGLGSLLVDRMIGDGAVGKERGKVCPRCGAEGKAYKGEHEAAVRNEIVDGIKVNDVGWRCWRCNFEWGFEFSEPGEPRMKTEGDKSC